MLSDHLLSWSKWGGFCTYIYKQYGIQSLNDAKKNLPPNKIHWTDKERPERRYSVFLQK